MTERKTICRVTEKGTCCEGVVIAPSSGKVISASKDTVRIFIPYSENHELYAPITGMVSGIQSEYGNFEKNVFEAKTLKRLKVVLDIDGDIPIKVEAFTGFPFRPKRIRVDVNEMDVVNEGQKIGEILLGSMTETHFPIGLKAKPLFGGIEFTPTVNFLDKVEGGKTIIATWRTCTEEKVEM